MNNLKTKRLISLFIIAMCIFMIAGCGKKSLTKTDEEIGTNNAADSDEEYSDIVEEIDMDSFKEGKWKERECSMTNISSSSSEDTCDAKLTISIYEQLSDEEILSIVKYYWEEKFDNGNNYNESKVNFCYAIFYDKDTFDVLNKIKYGKDGSVSLTEEDNYMIDSFVSFDKAHNLENAK